MRKITFTQVFSISLPALFLRVSVSCRSSDTDNKTLNNGHVAINVNLVHDDYEDVEGKNIQVSNNQTLSLAGDLTQTKHVPFSGGFDLIAELKPEAVSLKNSAQASLNPAAAATPIKELLNSESLFTTLPDSMILRIFIV